MDICKELRNSVFVT